ncbi:Cytochrome c heme lyase subunit CcmF [Salmonella enterica subsp. enterica]|uniref:Cytochrome c heme lyase subunit CcmF n=1 Tax=Salmonella enterica I TaxID=59201 RepID=A0A379VHS3_SALET|nr:Cytochrome c heme lyase subunit CcmF [Salmonella enterica subsp. enterica]
MMPEYGHALLCLALGVALLLSVYPLWGVARGDARMMASAGVFAWLLFICVAGAFFVLVHAFVVNDFTVAYVAGNSNTQLPVWYRVAATWGAHEGSLLLWVLLMSGWTLAVAVFSRQVPADIVARVLAVMGMVCAGFLAFILFTSGPFARTLPAFPVEGRDLNPLLQDPGLIFHPPLLYMGYVGFSVAFAFAIAALLSGRLDSAFTRFARPWTLAAWVFLTLGIVLGSAWPTTSWAGAAGGSGTRWRTPPLCRGWRAPPCCTRWRSPNSAPALRRGRCCCPSAPSRCACWHLPGALRGAGVGARLRLRPGARNVYPRLYGAGHRRLAAAVRRARAQGAFAGEQHAVVARVAAARQQRPADGRHAGWCCWAPCCRWCTNSWGWAAFRWGSRSLTPCSPG